MKPPKPEKEGVKGPAKLSLAVEKAKDSPCLEIASTN